MSNDMESRIKFLQHEYWRLSQVYLQLAEWSRQLEAWQAALHLHSATGTPTLMVPLSLDPFGVHMLRKQRILALAYDEGDGGGATPRNTRPPSGVS